MQAFWASYAWVVPFLVAPIFVVLGVFVRGLIGRMGKQHFREIEAESRSIRDPNNPATRFTTTVRGVLPDEYQIDALARYFSKNGEAGLLLASVPFIALPLLSSGAVNATWVVVVLGVSAVVAFAAAYALLAMPVPLHKKLSLGLFGPGVMLMLAVYIGVVIWAVIAHP